MKARLDKILADSGLGTRSSVRDLIKSGTVKVNGISEKDPGKKVDTDMDEIIVRGELIDFRDKVYYMLNKPAGVITATEDKKQTTVIDLIKDKKRRDLFPVGRLDKDTVGLLLITNDGDLAHRLLAPGKHVKKTYLVRVDGIITDEIKSGIENGVDIGDEKLTAPAELREIKLLGDAVEAVTGEQTAGCVSEAEITITEGRYHEIKRMFEAFGLNVIYLKRLSMGGLKLDPDLQEGQWKILSEKEIALLTKQYPEA
jgi:16S rRNA pseudouridine516 synthase